MCVFLIFHNPIPRAKKNLVFSVFSLICPFYFILVFAWQCPDWSVSLVSLCEGWKQRWQWRLRKLGARFELPEGGCWREKWSVVGPIFALDANNVSSTAGGFYWFSSSRVASSETSRLRQQMDGSEHRKKSWGKNLETKKKEFFRFIFLLWNMLKLSLAITICLGRSFSMNSLWNRMLKLCFPWAESLEKSGY